MSINSFSSMQSLVNKKGPAAAPGFTPFTITNALFDAQAISTGQLQKYFSGWTTSGDVTNTWTTYNNTSYIYGTLAVISPQYSLYQLSCQIYNAGNTSVSFTQSCPFPIGTYSISVWAIPRKTYYNSSMSFVIKINGQNVFTPVTFTTGTTTTPFTHFTGTYTETVGAYHDVVLYWANTASNDSTILISNLVITKTA